MKIEVNRKPSKLLLHIQFPLFTLQRISSFLMEKNIMVETLLLMDDGKHRAILVLHLLMEEEFHKKNIELLTCMPGVISLEEEDEAIEKKGLLRVLLPKMKKE